MRSFRLLRKRRPQPTGRPRCLARRWALVAWVLALTGLRGEAQDSSLLRFDHLSIDQGLSQSTVFAIAQDRQGFMWFGTQDGLSKYDGYSFVVYRPQPEDPASLSDNNVLSLYNDREGMLWIGTEGGGLNRFNVQTGAITRFRHDPSNPTSIGHDWVAALTGAAKGGLWVGTNGGGLDKMSKEGGFEHLTDAAGNPLCSRQITALVEDRGGDLWIGTSEEGLCRLDPRTGTLTRFRNDARVPGGLRSDAVRALHQDRSGVLWVGTMDGLARFDPKTGRFQRFRNDPKRADSLSHNNVYAILDDRKAHLWVGTQNGLNRFDRSTNTFTRYLSDPAQAESLSDNLIYSLFEDDSGLLWVGTGSGGVSKLNPRKTQFEHITVRIDRRSSLSNPVVWSICPDRRGNLWVGTENGLNRRSPGADGFVSYRYDPAQPLSLSNDNVRSVIEDHTGQIWIATDGGGVNRFSEADSRFIRYLHNPDDPRSLSSNSTLKLYEDRSGALWVGTRGGGISRLDPDRKRFDRFMIGTRPLGLSNDNVYAVLEDRQGAMWFGTLGGLNRLDPQRGDIRYYRNDSRDPSSLSDDAVGVLFEDRQGRLWVGTDHGLNRMVPESGSFVRYTVKEGLPNDFINGILQDPGGFLWISTNRGLSRMDPASGTFRNYDVNDGLQSNEFNSGASAVDAQGRFYFRGVNGFNVFSPGEIETNPYIPPVVITAFRALDKPVAPNPDGRAVTLSYRQNFVSFEFAALDYTVPEKNRFQYRLEGFDRGFVPTGNRHFASYTNLPGGEYTFRVKAANSDGVWNEVGTEVSFRVTSPPWKSWWAFLGYAALLLAAVSATVRYQTRTEALALTERLRRMTTSLSQTLDLAQVMERLLDHLAEVIPYDEAQVFLRTEKGWEAKATRRRGGFSGVAPRDEAELLTRIETTGQPVWVTTPAAPVPSTAEATKGEGFCGLGIPIWTRERVTGIVLLHGGRVVKFAKQAADLAITLVNQAGFAVENAQLFSRITELATLDGLTGVTNRRHFFELAERELKSALRYQRSLSLIMLDLDHFKRINDSYGHAVGDEMLRMVANVCRSCLRETDIVARYGGEEFVMLLSETDEAAAFGAAERVCAALAEARPRIDERELVGITASLGVASIRAKDSDLGALIKRADMALYQAKKRGRNRVELAAG